MKRSVTAVVGSVIVACVSFAMPLRAQTTVTSFAPATNVTPGVWYESDVRPGGTASVTDLTGTGGNLEANQPLPIGAAKLTTDLTNASKTEVAVLNDYGVLGDIAGLSGVL